MKMSPSKWNRTIRRELKKEGLSVVRTETCHSVHTKYYVETPSGPQMLVTGSSGDWRALKNTKAQIARMAR